MGRNLVNRISNRRVIKVFDRRPSKLVDLRDTANLAQWMVYNLFVDSVTIIDELVSNAPDVGPLIVRMVWQHTDRLGAERRVDVVGSIDIQPVPQCLAAHNFKVV